jgi:hypothetical protein
MNNFSSLYCFHLCISTNSSISYTYSVNNIIFNISITLVKDLGSILTRNLCTNMYIQQMVCKSLKLLNFINRVSKAFKLLSHLNILYYSLVRRVLEYDSVLRTRPPPFACNMIKRVQRNFFCHLAYKLIIHYPPKNYTPVQCFSSIESLTDRWYSTYISFLYNLFSSKIALIYYPV